MDDTQYYTHLVSDFMYVHIVYPKKGHRKGLQKLHLV